MRSSADAMRDLDDLFAALAESDFRRRQKLGKKDRRYLEERSLSTLLTHARRLAPDIRRITSG